ncbi:MAG TPA: IclR family transcriptional regulator [Microlunatus sp.]|nr:IclR family transcriptional regulator [Microlunatus sp.]
MPENAVRARSGGVQSVERAFDLLEIMAEAGGEISLSDLSATAKLPMPTIHRLLRTCVKLGYARQLPSRRYALGARLIPLGELAGRQLGRVAQPRLAEIVQELGETANMALLDGDHVVYVAQQPSLHAMRMFTEIGRRVNLHDTGVGKAILAGMSDDEVRGIMNRVGMPTPTAKSHSTIDSLLADLDQIRQRGYAIDNEEQEIGVRCYAVAIPGSPSAMAISVSGPLARVDEEFGRRAVPVLRRAADAIAADLVS